MKTYKAFYYRSPDGFSEIGPQSEVLEIAASTKKEATKTAKTEASQRDWRFLELVPNFIPATT